LPGFYYHVATVANHVVIIHMKSKSILNHMIHLGLKANIAKFSKHNVEAFWSDQNLELLQPCMPLDLVSNKRGKKSCCLVWQKESLDPYEIWVVHKGITKQYHCIVKVCGLFLCWLLGCSESKILNFWPIFLEKSCFILCTQANQFISIVSYIDLDYIYAKYGKEHVLHPESMQFSRFPVHNGHNSCRMEKDIKDLLVHCT